MTRVSIVINTCNRSRSLAHTLASLTWLDHDDFEVVVVDGPSTDDTAAVLEAWSDRIKIGHCEHLNLAESRNIGIALAAGEMVAFIDDDACPDPGWLTPLLEGYDHDEVAGVGGPVYDHTGVTLQTRYNLCTRLSDVTVSHDVNPSAYVCAPYSDLILYMIGTNSTYRRDRLVEIGGFDEEFEYYLDDTEVCARLADSGYRIKVLDDGFVYHRFLESHIRTPRRHFRYRYPIIKNKLYFALRFGLVTHSFDEVCDYITGFIRDQHRDFEQALEMGWLSEEDYTQFKVDVPAAFDAALTRWASGVVRTRERSWFAERQQPYKRFVTRRRPQDKLNICFLTIEYPPKPVAGIGRVVYNLATGLAGVGHVVHVLMPGEGHDTVDLEDGVWVHRIVPREHVPPEALHVPPSVWFYTATLRDELRRIHEHRPVDIVQCPNWGSQGIAVMLDGTFRTVLGMYTPLRTITSMDHRLALGTSADAHVTEMVNLEEWCYRHADAFLACSPSIVEEVEAQYAVDLPRDRVGFVAHGLPDRAAVTEEQRDADEINVLFVGRLEPRKGIDVLLACIPELVARFPRAVFTLVGDDTIPSERGRTYRDEFQQSPANASILDRVRFLGAVDDDELWRQYALCDIFVAPSRYESFGLILVEAMILAKPVIACTIGGMAEIVEVDGNGFLVPPGDVTELRDAIAQLLESSVLRERFGRRSRELYEERYGIDRMVDGANRFYDSLAGRETVDAKSLPPSPQMAAVALPPTPEADSNAPEPPAPREAMTPSSDAGGRTRLGMPDLRDKLRCPTCHQRLRPLYRTVTEDGRPKTGQFRCSDHGVVAAVEQFILDFRPDPLPEPLPDDVETTIIPAMGERRMHPGDSGLVVSGDWRPHNDYLVSAGTLGDEIATTAVCTDVIVRFMTNAWSGIVDVFVDDVLVRSVDLYEREGANTVAVAVLADALLALRTIRVRPRGTAHSDAHAAQVFFHGFVFYGPKREGFDDPVPLNYGNGYSPVIESYLANVSADQLILEAGGGDRRRCQDNHINVDFLKVELADAYSDIHRLPFDDDTFDFVFSQAVFEHLADPFAAAEELQRVTRPGGLILTEVAFMQPLHAAPFHFFNMTPWGVEELFKSCTTVDRDWFGPLSETVDWLMRAAELPGKVSQDRLGHILAELRDLDQFIDHDRLRPVAGAVWLVVRKDSPVKAGAA